MIMVVMMASVVAMIQWFFFGYSLAFSESGSNMLGNFNYGILMNTGINALVGT